MASILMGTHKYRYRPRCALVSPTPIPITDVGLWVRPTSPTPPMSVHASFQLSRLRPQALYRFRQLVDAGLECISEIL